MNEDQEPRSTWIIHVLTTLLFIAATIWFSQPLFFFRSEDTAHLPRWEMHSLLFDSHERLHYVIRLSEFVDAVRHQQFVPRWCANLAGGFGDPLFNFYAPLAYAGASVWVGTGMGLFLAWKLQLSLVMLLTLITTRLYARLWLSPFSATIAALLYGFAPYHIGNLYVRGNVAEFTAMALVPLALFCYHRLWRAEPDRMWRWAAFAALSHAAILLCHNVTALFATTLLAAEALVCCLVAQRGAVLGRSILAAGLALNLATFFVIPALVELRYCGGAGLGPTYQGTPNHVVYWPQFISEKWGHGLSLAGPGDGMSFSLGLPTLVGLAGTAMLLLVRFRRPPLWTVALLISGGALLAMMSPVSQSLWALPGFKLIQFPWRLLAFASLYAAVAAAAALDFFPGRFAKSGWFRLPAVVALAVGIGAWSQPRLTVPAYYPNLEEAYHPTNTRQNYTTTNMGDFRPKWAADSPIIGKISTNTLTTLSGDAVKRVPPSNLLNFKTEITSAPADRSPLLYPALFFPGWTATIDGKPADIKPSREGLVQISITDFPASLHIWWGDTLVRKYAGWISLSGLLVTLVLLLIPVGHRRQSTQIPPQG